MLKNLFEFNVNDQTKVVVWYAKVGKELINDVFVADGDFSNG